MPRRIHSTISRNIDALKTNIDNINQALNADIVTQPELDSQLAAQFNTQLSPLIQRLDEITAALNRAGVPDWVGTNTSLKVFDKNPLGHQILFTYAASPDLDDAGLRLKPFDAPRDSSSNLYWAMTASRDPISWHESLGPYLRPDVHVVQHMIGTTINEYHVVAALDPAEYTTEPQNLTAKYKLKLTYSIA